MTNPDGLKYWIALRKIYGVGDVLARQLLAKFKDPKAIFNASYRDIVSVEGINEKVGNAVKEFSDWVSVDKEIETIQKENCGILTLADPAYPQYLFNTYNPPPVLYMHGEIEGSDDLAIAIVGSRIPDHYGEQATRKIARGLSERGITVVSGMARGIDSIAHRAALEAGGRTIAVLGSGLDVIYPPENRLLYEKITKSGAVLSEFQLGTKPEQKNFPRRNRVISGLSLGVVVVQATQKSGSLITASYALDQNREVFAVPGRITSALSKGTNWLLKNGAKPIDSAEDIIKEIALLGDLEPRKKELKKPKPLPELSPDQTAVYTKLGEDPIHIDQITRECGMDSSKILSILLYLELHDLVRQTPGKMFHIPDR